MSATARAQPNIALIKYWGNRNDAMRLPEADSTAMTLDSPSVTVTAEHSEILNVRSFGEDGKEKILTEKDTARFGKHIDLMKNYFLHLNAEEALPCSLSLTIRSGIPSAVGIASSSAVFAAVARAVAGLVEDIIPLTDTQVSILARLGSGSAARSIFSGFAALRAGGGSRIDASFGQQIADVDHWLLHDVIIAPSTAEKKVGSTEGHALAHTSPFFEARLAAIRMRRLKECVEAILRKDFELLQRVSEEDCMDMHKVMETSTPALHYLSEETHRIVSEIKDLRQKEHVPVLYTMDAGPTVHLFCPDEGYLKVLAYARKQEEKGCRVFDARAGEGAKLVRTKKPITV